MKTHEITKEGKGLRSLCLFVTIVMVVSSCFQAGAMVGLVGPTTARADTIEIMGPPALTPTDTSRSGRTDLPEDVNPYQYHAEAAARWLISIAIEKVPGQYKWYFSDLMPDQYYTEFCEGAAGVGTFFLELYKITGNATYLKYAEGAGRWIISQGVTVSSNSTKWPILEGYPSYKTDLFGGAAGIGQYLLDLSTVTGNQTYMTYSKKAANWILASAEAENGGYKWELDPGRNFTGWAHGVAGISDFLIGLWNATGNMTYKAFGEGGAKWLISIANTTVPGQYSWVRIQTDKHDDISWCGGTTGIVLFLLRIYEVTKNTIYLDYAKGGGNYMISEATDTGPGSSSFMGINIYCHGDPSSSYVMLKLYELTGNATYRRYGEQSANWTISTGVQVNKKQMKWPSMIGTDYYETGIMRGGAGIGHQMIYIYKTTKETRYKDYALMAANWLGNISIEVSPGVEKWNWEERLGTDKEFCTNWYYGAPGIGLFMIEMVPYWTPPPVKDVHSVDLVGDDQVGHAEPGKKVQYQVQLKNTGNVADKVEISLGHAWPVEKYLEETDILAGDTRTLFVNVTVPIAALAGEKDTLAITAWPLGDQTATDTLRINTSAEAVYAVDIVGKDQTGNLRPGEVHNYTLEIRNEGNAKDDFELTSTAVSTGWSLSISFDDGDLLPKAPRTAVVSLGAPLDAAAGSNQTVSITAQSMTDPSRTDTVELTTYVDPVFGVDIVPVEVSGSTDPLKPIVHSVDVINLGNTIDTIELLSSPPKDGWMVDTNFDGTMMTPGETRVAKVKITPPVFELAFTNMTTVLSARSIGDPTRSDQATVTTRVLPKKDLDVIVPEGATVLPGQTATYAFTIKNKGNVEDQYELKVASKNGWSVKLLDLEASNRTAAIGPLNSTKVLVEATVPPLSDAGAKDLLTLTVTADLPGDDLIIDATVATTVETVKMVQIASNITHAQMAPTIGSSVSFDLTVTNSGNAEIEATLEISSPTNLAGHLSATVLTVPVRSTKGLSLKVTSLQAAGDQPIPAGNYTIRVTLKSEQTTRHLNLTVEVLPVTKPNNTHTQTSMSTPFVLLVVVLIAVASTYLVFRRLRKETKKVDNRTVDAPNDGSWTQETIKEDWQE